MNTSNQPLVTYVIPCYNQGQYVEEAIKSIIAQDYDRIELIVINDGSTDCTENVIFDLEVSCRERFERFCIVSRENKGFVYSLNEGLGWAKGEYFALLASDDCLLSFKTSRMIETLSREGTDVVAAYAGVEIIDEFGKHVRKISPRAGRYGFDEIFLKKCPYQTPTQLIRTSELRRIGGFDKNFVSEDWIMLLNLTLGGKAIVIDDSVVTKYRRHSSNMSKNIDLNHNYRLKVLDKFKNHELYFHAKSLVLAGHAGEIADISIKDSVNSLVDAYLCYPKVVLEKKFRRGLLSVVRSMIGFSNDRG
ncbi:glycosyltransferase [Paradonghicola geojensis]|nr:glycosyltransferase [Marivivens geojensis]